MWEGARGAAGAFRQMPLRVGCPVQVEEVAPSGSLPIRSSNEARRSARREDPHLLERCAHVPGRSDPGRQREHVTDPELQHVPTLDLDPYGAFEDERDLPLLRGPRHRTLRRREAREPGPPRRDAPARASRFRARRGPVASRRSLPSIRTHQDASRDHPPSCGHATNHFAGGRTGIRTLERVAPLTVFKTVAFVRSAILPPGAYRRICPISRCGLGWLVRGGSDPSTAGGAR